MMQPNTTHDGDAVRVVTYLGRKGVKVTREDAVAAVRAAESRLASTTPEASHSSPEFRTAVCKLALSILTTPAPPAPPTAAPASPPPPPAPPSDGMNSMSNIPEIIRSYEAEREGAGNVVPRDLPPELGGSLTNSSSSTTTTPGAVFFLARSWEHRPSGRAAATGMGMSFHNPVRAARNFLHGVTIPSVIASRGSVVTVHVSFGSGSISRSWLLVANGMANGTTFETPSREPIDVTGWVSMEVRDYAGATIGPAPPVLDIKAGVIRAPGGAHTVREWLASAPVSGTREVRAVPTAASGGAAVVVVRGTGGAPEAASDDVVPIEVLGGRVPAGQTSFWVTDLGLTALMSRPPTRT